MAIEEKEKQETLLNELIEKIEKDPLPTNIFTTEDTDPLVLLGKLNEVIAHLKELRALYFESDSKASEALTKAIDSLEKAQQAITIATTLGNEAKGSAQEAINTANSANDTAGEAMAEAVDALQKAVEAVTKAQNAETTAQTANNTANEALSQVTQGLGTKVHDNHGNILANAKFTGHNGINVDMAENDPEEFNIRLDADFVGQIEQMQTNIASNETKTNENTSKITALNSQVEMAENLAESLEEEINTSIKPRLTSVESTASANASDLEGVHNLIDALNSSVDNLNYITPAVHPASNYNCSTLFDAGIYLVSNGLNCPSELNYGTLLVMPYRKAKGNTIQDYCVQIFLPNGDDYASKGLYYRLSLSNNWLTWNKLQTFHDAIDGVRGETIFSGNVGAGTINITKAFNNFDIIATIATWDNGTNAQVSYTPVWLLREASASQNEYNKEGVNILTGHCHWDIYRSDIYNYATTLRSNNENAVLRKIIGIKF